MITKTLQLTAEQYEFLIEHLETQRFMTNELCETNEDYGRDSSNEKEAVDILDVILEQLQ